MAIEYGKPRPIMREEPPRPKTQPTQPKTQPKPVAPTPTPYGGQNTGEYYRQYYESLRKQAEARQRAEMAAAQRAQAEYIRQQQIQMREQPQPQQYGVQQGAPVIRDTMPNMTQIAPPVVRDTMPRMPQTTQYAPVIRNTVPTDLEGWTHYDYPAPTSIFKPRTELPYYDQPMTRAFAQWLGNVYPETYDYGLGVESPDVFSNYGPSEWIKPEGPPAPTRHGPITNPRTIQAMQDIMNVDFTYNPAIDSDTLPGEGDTGSGFGYFPYNYTPYRYGGYSYPKYDFKYPEPVKSWYENMLQWNI